MRWMSISTSGNSSARASARGRVRLRTVTFLQPLEARCLTSRRDILPAPMMATRASSKSCEGSLSCTSSAAAEDTDTEPVEMDVSVRTRFPAVMACLKSPFRWRPNPFTSWPPWYTALTCARIWPSPITRLSSPAETRSRCDVASESRSRKTYGRRSSSAMPDCLAIHSSTSRTPEWKARATT